MAHLKPSLSGKARPPPLPSQLKGSSSNRFMSVSAMVTPSINKTTRTPKNPASVSLSVPRSVRSNASPSLQQNSNSSGNANFQTPGGSAGPQQKKQITEEQLLRREYTLYLQAGVMNMLTKKMAEMNNKVDLEKVGQAGCSNEVENVLNIRNYLIQQNTWLEMVDCLMKTNKMTDIFLELKHQFSEDKTRTLNGMRISLENRFNKIWLGLEDTRQGQTRFPPFPSSFSSTNNNLPKRIRAITNEDLQSLAERVKVYISKVDEDDDEKIWRDKNPQFIVNFIDALTQLVQDHDVITSNNKEGDQDVETNVDAMSSMISSQTVAKQRNKQNKPNNQKSAYEAKYLLEDC
ncbi:uncharacterized protein LOC110855923 [Folsomia candida]|uniref:Uncharacterized protein n=1 Tax=Folsomia candida TaxID=158441 RepID=A0A226DQ92_FOLCA|nr:uncharacterized protein LOC110855923 [Folsomia candida]XP_035712562.1 uncharacterized protein LOC110855923 [Folsomia candida]OXA47014.1 hypothetical protein Fcan01_18330 [Folsomia candida]